MRLIIALLVLVFVGLQSRLWFGAGSWEQIVSLERDLAEQTAINDRLAARNDRLAAEIYDLKHGLDAVEQRARTELGLIKSNETFYLIVDD